MRIMKIGVDCGATFIKAGLVTNNKIIKKVILATQASKGKSVSLHNLLSSIQKLYIPSVKRIGIGFPAPVDTLRGRIGETNNIPGWKDVYLKRIIERKFHVPCTIDNDARCFTLAEFRYGAGKQVKNMVGITLGTGVGMGIVINGQLYAGNTGAAGEISRVPYNGKNIENIANIHFFKKIARMNSQTVYEKLKTNNHKAKKIIKQFGVNLGIIISIVVDIIDPELIVLGGGLSNLFPYFKKPMLVELKKHCFAESFKKLKITRSTLKDVAILGAASLDSNYG